jgi:hypothetical protein
VKKIYNRISFDSDIRFIKDEEIDYLKMMVKNRVNGVGPFSDEVKRIC